MGRYNAAKTHCKRGHAFTPDNTYITSLGGRQCRNCRRLNVNRRYAETAHLRSRKKHPGKPRRPPLDRFAEKVMLADNGCYEWTAGTTQAGHGVFGRGGRGHSNAVAHRWLWEETVGSVPDGLELDHLCRNPACVNVDHLEPVTHAENMRRSPIVGWNFRVRRTHCKYDHEFTEDNTRYDKRGRRECRACRRRISLEHARRYPEKMKARAAVKRAVQRGEALRPSTCDECGKTTRVDAAHYDYIDQLRVRWLCRQCHYDWDKSRGLR